MNSHEICVSSKRHEMQKKPEHNDVTAVEIFLVSKLNTQNNYHQYGLRMYTGSRRIQIVYPRKTYWGEKSFRFRAVLLSRLNEGLENLLHRKNMFRTIRFWLLMHNSINKIENLPINVLCVCVCLCVYPQSFIVMFGYNYRIIKFYCVWECINKLSRGKRERRRKNNLMIRNYFDCL